MILLQETRPFYAALKQKARSFSPRFSQPGYAGIYTGKMRSKTSGQCFSTISEDRLPVRQISA